MNVNRKHMNIYISAIADDRGTEKETAPYPICAVLPLFIIVIDSRLPTDDSRL